MARLNTNQSIRDRLARCSPLAQRLYWSEILPACRRSAHGRILRLHFLYRFIESENYSEIVDAVAELRARGVIAHITTGGRLCLEVRGRAWRE